MKAFLTHVAAAALVLASTCAWSGAMYSSSAVSAFSIGTADAVEINSNTGSKFEFGTASASHSTVSITGSGVRPATKSIEVSGSAIGPGTSFATSTRMTGHVIRIDNEGAPGIVDTVELRIPFAFVFSWDVLLSADDPARDFASAGAFFALSGFEAGIDAVDIDGDGLGSLTDPFLSSAYIFNPTYTTLGGGTGGSGTLMSVTGVIIVRAESIGEFSVITDATGRAFHLPEPGSLLLAGLALAGLAATRRRKAG